MGKLEQMSTGESQPKIETKTPPEVAEMDRDLIKDARVIFGNNHELVKEAMFGMGSRKAKEVLQQLSECREATKGAVQKFRTTKEKLFPEGLQGVQAADIYREKIAA